ncbi:MAG: anthrone oxygenase family protein [Cyanobacteria bacterium J06635_10]
MNLHFFLMLITAIGSGVSGGIFYAFSTFVIKALAQQPPAQGIATMQSINITVINPWFMMVFLGTGVACILITIFLLRQWHQPGTIYWLAGSLLYLIGTIGVTIAFNIPLNDALAAIAPNSVQGARLWARFLTDWTFWNHVRTAAAILAAIILTISLYQQTESQSQWLGLLNPKAKKF